MTFSDPFKILSPDERWAPSQSQMDAFQNATDKLLPFLVYTIRLAVEKKEFIRIKNDKGVTKEKWEGNYLFENEWQSYRTRGKSNLEFTNFPHQYSKLGKYKVVVKMVNVLGVDTSDVVEVRV